MAKLLNFPKRSNYGWGMLEVLITLAMLSFGMLGIGAMLIMANKASTSTYLRQQSIQSISNIIDRVRANRQAAVNGNYNVSNITSSGAPSIPATPGVNCDNATCTSTQLAAYDKWSWLAKDVANLPSGAGSINVASSGNNSILTVTIQWDDSVAQSLLGAGSQASSSNPELIQLTVSTLL